MVNFTFTPIGDERKAAAAVGAPVTAAPPVEVPEAEPVIPQFTFEPVAETPEQAFTFEPVEDEAKPVPETDPELLGQAADSIRSAAKTSQGEQRQGEVPDNSISAIEPDMAPEAQVENRQNFAQQEEEEITDALGIKEAARNFWRGKNVGQNISGLGAINEINPLAEAQLTGNKISARQYLAGGQQAYVDFIQSLPEGSNRGRNKTLLDQSYIDRGLPLEPERWKDVQDEGFGSRKIIEALKGGVRKGAYFPGKTDAEIAELLFSMDKQFLEDRQGIEQRDRTRPAAIFEGVTQMPRYMLKLSKVGLLTWIVDLSQRYQTRRAPEVQIKANGDIKVDRVTENKWTSMWKAGAGGLLEKIIERKSRAILGGLGRQLAKLPTVSAISAGLTNNGLVGAVRSTPVAKAVRKIVEKIKPGPKLASTLKSVSRATGFGSAPEEVLEELAEAVKVAVLNERNLPGLMGERMVDATGEWVASLPVLVPTMIIASGLQAGPVVLRESVRRRSFIRQKAKQVKEAYKLNGIELEDQEARTLVSSIIDAPSAEASAQVVQDFAQSKLSDEVEEGVSFWSPEEESVAPDVPEEGEAAPVPTAAPGLSPATTTAEATDPVTVDAKADAIIDAGSTDVISVEPQIQDLADKIAAGNTEFTDAELELQTNQAERLEEVLQERAVEPDVPRGTFEPGVAQELTPQRLTELAETPIGELAPAELGSQQVLEARFPPAADTVDNRLVGEGVPNQDSIGATFGEFDILPGIREVSMDDFSITGRGDTVAGNRAIEELQAAISESGEITPLIVAVDAEGPFILEGATRIDALKNLGAKSFPAQVVIDRDSLQAEQAAAEEQRIPAPQPVTTVPGDQVIQPEPTVTPTTVAGQPVSAPSLDTATATDIQSQDRRNQNDREQAYQSDLEARNAERAGPLSEDQAAAERRTGDTTSRIRGSRPGDPGWDAIWQPVAYSPGFARTADFQIAQQLGAANGLDVLPVSNLPSNAALLGDTVLLDDQPSEGIPSQQALHEILHALNRRGDANAAGIVAAVKVDSDGFPFYAQQVNNARAGMGMTALPQTQLAEEIAADFMGSLLDRGALSTDDMFGENIEAAEEARRAILAAAAFEPAPAQDITTVRPLPGSADTPADQIVLAARLGDAATPEPPVTGDVPPPPIFKSVMFEVTEGKLPATVRGPQLGQLLEGWANQGLFKRAELEESGMVQWAAEQEGKISKDDVLSEMETRTVQVAEVLKRDDIADQISPELNEYLADVRDELVPQTPTEWAELSDTLANTAAEFQSEGSAAEAQQFFEMADEATRFAEGVQEGTTADQSKFSQWQLPGGENYSELLLTLPERGVEKLTKQNVIPLEPGTDPVAVDPARFWYFQVPGNVFLILKSQHPTQVDALAHIIENKQPEPTLDLNYRSSHWDEANVVAHIRFNERTGPDGKKILMVEEVQSDWHQEGRRKGYRQLSNEQRLELNEQVQTLTERIDAIAQPGGLPFEQRFDDPSERLIAERAALLQDLATDGIIADAPFKKNWHELAMKRMFRWAVDNGFDTVAWTTGEQQGDRYDLSKQIDDLSYRENDDGTFTLSGTKDGSEVFAARTEAAKLPDVVGKDIAEKILAGEGTKVSTPGVEGTRLFGVDLKVGVEGMNVFYDKILPSFVKKATKKWKANVGTTQILTTPAAQDQADIELLEELESLPEGVEPVGKDRRTTVHALDISPAMRESVASDPQPLFAVRRELPQEGKPKKPLTARAREKRAVGLERAFAKESKKIAVGRAKAKAEREALEKVSKAELRGKAIGQKEGKRVGRVERAAEIRAQIKFKKETAEQTKKDIVAFAKENLLKVDVPAIEKKAQQAKGSRSFQRVLNEIEALGARQEKAEAVTEFRAELLKIRKTAFRPEFIAIATEWFEQFDPKSPTGTTTLRLQRLNEFINKNPDHKIPDDLLKEVKRLDQIPIADIDAQQLRQMTDALRALQAQNDLKKRLIIDKKNRTVAQHADDFADNSFSQPVKRKEIRPGLSEPKDGVVYQGRLASMNLETLLHEVEDGQPGPASEMVFTKTIKVGQEARAEAKRGVAEFIDPRYKAAGIDRKDVVAWSQPLMDSTGKGQLIASSVGRRLARFVGPNVSTVEKAITKLGGRRFAKRIARRVGNRAKTLRIDTDDGKILTLTYGEAANLWNHVKNIRSIKNILDFQRGGIRIGESEKDRFFITPGDLDNIFGQLPDEVKQAADINHEYRNTVQRDLMNETSNKRINVDVAQEANYAKLHRSSQDVLERGVTKGSLPTASPAAQALDDRGFLQARSGIRAPVVIVDEFATFWNEVNNANQYIGMAEPIALARSFMSQNRVEKAIIRRHGKPMVDAINKAIDEIENPPRLSDNWFVKKVEAARQRIVKAVLGAGGVLGGVAAKQPVSYIAASTEIDAKFLKAALKKKLPTRELVAESSAILGERLGSGRVERDVSPGDSALNFWTGEMPLADKLMKPISFSDGLAIRRIWSAAELEIDETQPKLKGEARLKAIGERAEEITRKTQPVFSLEDRSSIGRSRDELTRLATSFTSQLNQNAQMLIRAANEYNGSEQTLKDKQTLAGKLLTLLVVMPFLIAGIDELRHQMLLASGVRKKRKKDLPFPARLALDTLKSNLRVIYVIGPAVSKGIDFASGRGFIGGEGIDNIVSSTLNTLIRGGGGFAKGALDGRWDKRTFTQLGRALLALQNMTAGLAIGPIMKDVKALFGFASMLAPDAPFVSGATPDDVDREENIPTVKLDFAKPAEQKFTFEPVEEEEPAKKFVFTPVE